MRLLKSMTSNKVVKRRKEGLNKEKLCCPLTRKHGQKDERKRVRLCYHQ